MVCIKNPPQIESYTDRKGIAMSSLATQGEETTFSCVEYEIQQAPDESFQQLYLLFLIIFLVLEIRSHLNHG